MFPDTHTHTHHKATWQSLAIRADNEDGMGRDFLGSGVRGWGAGRRPWQLVYTRPGTHLESSVRALSAP